MNEWNETDLNVSIDDCLTEKERIIHKNNDMRQLIWFLQDFGAL